MFGAIIFCLSILHVESIIVQPLKNYEWRVQNVKKRIEESVIIPGGIYSDLSKAGILPNILLYRFNDVNSLWVGKESWTYFVNFSADERILNTSAAELIFHGLDGTAKIFFNDKEIGAAVNTFVRYRFDVTNLLQTSNTLKIVFDSPITTSSTLAKQSAKGNPFHCEARSEWNGVCYVYFLRRMQASFGSNIAPAFPSVGIWKEVELVSYQNDILIGDILVSTIPEKNDWKVTIGVYYEPPLHVREIIEGNFKVVILLKDNKLIELSKEIEVNANTHHLTFFEEFTVLVSENDVELWWPNGYGPQNLYQLTVTFDNKITSTTKSIKFGFRTVELIQKLQSTDENDEELGKNVGFYFTVNDIPIFAKGANYVPSDILLENTSDPKTIKWLLHSSKIANMNMLRVSSVGIYESNYFYELCDEYGILVWQEMMFDILYPIDEDFLSSVSDEIIQQTRRLQYHPSIAIWVGTRRTAAATNRKRSIRKNEFEELKSQLISRMISLIDTSRPYLVASPNSSNSIFTNPSFLFDDSYFYNKVAVDNWITDNYRETRFSLEFGLQSFPSLDTLKKVADAKDLSSVKTPFMRHRQHREIRDANRKIIDSIRYHFGKPKPNDLDNIIYASQIDQAWSVKSRIEWHRAHRSSSPSQNNMAMGVLYWQLNDMWQAPTWSSIEYGGKWKILQYYARKFFNPVLVSADMDKNSKVTIRLISDLLIDKEANLKIVVFSWDSMTPVFTEIKTVRLKKESSKIHLASMENFFSKEACMPSKPQKHCFLKLSLLEKDDNVIIDNYFFPSSIKNAIGLRNATVTASVIICHNKECTLEIKTDAIALFVWLDTGYIDGYFSDNGFIMTEPEKKIVFYYSDDTVDINDVQKSLQIKVMDENRLKNKFS